MNGIAAKPRKMYAATVKSEHLSKGNLNVQDSA
jgi:hypothetical protein